MNRARQGLINLVLAKVRGFYDPNTGLTGPGDNPDFRLLLVNRAQAQKFRDLYPPGQADNLYTLIPPTTTMAASRWGHGNGCYHTMHGLLGCSCFREQYQSSSVGFFDMVVILDYIGYLSAPEIEAAYQLLSPASRVRLPETLLYVGAEFLDCFNEIPINWRELNLEAPEGCSQFEVKRGVGQFLVYLQGNPLPYVDPPGLHRGRVRVTIEGRRMWAVRIVFDYGSARSVVLGSIDFSAIELDDVDLTRGCKYRCITEIPQRGWLTRWILPSERVDGFTVPVSVYDLALAIVRRGKTTSADYNAASLRLNSALSIHAQFSVYNSGCVTDLVDRIIRIARADTSNEHWSLTRSYDYGRRREIVTRNMVYAYGTNAPPYTSKFWYVVGASLCFGRYLLWDTIKREWTTSARVAKNLERIQGIGGILTIADTIRRPNPLQSGLFSVASFIRDREELLDYLGKSLMGRAVMLSQVPMIFVSSLVTIIGTAILGELGFGMGLGTVLLSSALGEEVYYWALDKVLPTKVGRALRVGHGIIEGHKLFGGVVHQLFHTVRQRWGLVPAVLLHAGVNYASLSYIKTHGEPLFPTFWATSRNPASFGWLLPISVVGATAIYWLWIRTEQYYRNKVVAGFADPSERRNFLPDALEFLTYTCGRGGFEFKTPIPCEHRENTVRLISNGVPEGINPLVGNLGYVPRARVFYQNSGIVLQWYANTAQCMRAGFNTRLFTPCPGFDTTITPEYVKYREWTCEFIVQGLHMVPHVTVAMLAQWYDHLTSRQKIRYFDAMSIIQRDGHWGGTKNAKGRPKILCMVKLETTAAGFQFLDWDNKVVTVTKTDKPRFIQYGDASPGEHVSPYSHYAFTRTAEANFDEFYGGHVNVFMQSKDSISTATALWQRAKDLHGDGFIIASCGDDNYTCFGPDVDPGVARGAAPAYVTEQARMNRVVTTFVSDYFEDGTFLSSFFVTGLRVLSFDPSRVPYIMKLDATIGVGSRIAMLVPTPGKALMKLAASCSDEGILDCYCSRMQDCENRATAFGFNRGYSCLWLQFALAYRRALVHHRYDFSSYVAPESKEEEWTAHLAKGVVVEDDQGIFGVMIYRRYGLGPTEWLDFITEFTDFIQTTLSPHLIDIVLDPTKAMPTYESATLARMAAIDGGELSTYAVSNLKFLATDSREKVRGLLLNSTRGFPAWPAAMYLDRAYLGVALNAIRVKDFHREAQGQLKNFSLVVCALTLVQAQIAAAYPRDFRRAVVHVYLVGGAPALYLPLLARTYPRVKFMVYDPRAVGVPGARNVRTFDGPIVDGNTFGDPRARPWYMPGLDDAGEELPVGVVIINDAYDGTLARPMPELTSLLIGAVQEEAALANRVNSIELVTVDKSRMGPGTELVFKPPELGDFRGDAAVDHVNYYPCLSNMDIKGPTLEYYKYALISLSENYIPPVHVVPAGRTPIAPEAVYDIAKMAVFLAHTVPTINDRISYFRVTNGWPASPAGIDAWPTIKARLYGRERDDELTADGVSTKPLTYIEKQLAVILNAALAVRVPERADQRRLVVYYLFRVMLERNPARVSPMYVAQQPDIWNPGLQARGLTPMAVLEADASSFDSTHTRASRGHTSLTLKKMGAGHDLMKEVAALQCVRVHGVGGVTWELDYQVTSGAFDTYYCNGTSTITEAMISLKHILGRDVVEADYGVNRRVLGQVDTTDPRALDEFLSIVGRRPRPANRREFVRHAQAGGVAPFIPFDLPAYARALPRRFEWVMAWLGF